MSETNKQLVQRYFAECFNRQNLDAAEEVMAAEYMEHALAPFGQVAPGLVHGPNHLRETVQWLVAQYPDLQMTIEALVAEGNIVVCRVLSEGTNLGVFNGVLPPTGKRFSAYQSHWFRIDNGKLAEHWATREDLPMLLQLGILEPPGRRPM
jgi:predicted ester cyclase